MDLFWGFITLPLKFFEIYIGIWEKIINFYLGIFNFWLTLPQQIMNFYVQYFEIIIELWKNSPAGIFFDFYAMLFEKLINWVAIFFTTSSIIEGMYNP